MNGLMMMILKKPKKTRNTLGPFKHGFSLTVSLQSGVTYK